MLITFCNITLHTELDFKMNCAESTDSKLIYNDNKSMLLLTILMEKYFHFCYVLNKYKYALFSGLYFQWVANDLKT